MINGIINIYKEQGFTSHDVVAKLRGILHFKHIGHTGTLDPMATGVLPVCIGSATKLCDMETAKTKIYEAVALFGIATDTEDVTGKVIKTLPVNCDEKDLVKVFEKFTGDIMQTPPMYSAIKLDGKKLYELARAGRTAEVAKRPVTIYSIELLDFEKDDEGHLKEARIRVTCGKGTYIRSLCRDLGEALGTCGCMKELERKKTGRFELETAVKLSDVAKAAEEGEPEKYILPIDEYFAEYPKCYTKPEFDKLVKNGNPLRAEEITTEVESCTYRAYDSESNFCGIYVFDERYKRFKPEKMFLSM
ncbi:MAG: tRNA pseudouridine(55) synthase TruB [Lachnospiraceae bacterium]|nr:tRNA pseudouridine(55) synthase TruB [Lachnospiraceae bacterium]